MIEPTMPAGILPKLFAYVGLMAASFGCLGWLPVRSTVVAMCVAGALALVAWGVGL